MSIQLSDMAASRVQHFLDNRGKGIGLRLGVKTTGCSGLAYVIEFVDELPKTGSGKILKRALRDRERGQG